MPPRRKKRVVKRRRRVKGRTKGRGIFSNIKKGIMKAGKFLKKHKVLSSLGVPGASIAGYGRGMRKKAPQRKIKGGALKRGGNLGRAGGALVRAGNKRPVRRRAYAKRRRGTGMRKKTSFP